MTPTVSFKDKLKQALAFFRWDLKACVGTLAVFSILATVFTTIILTLCLVIGINANNEYLISSYVSDSGLTPFATSVVLFQVISVYLLYFMTAIFTIFYTIKVFSYLHNKRKADLYGSLPVGRVTLYLTKAASAYIFSVIPTLFFMGIISIISLCLGQPLISEVTQVYLKIIIGALACISAYGLLSVCCGTTFNAVVMFITVCIAYPISAMFIKGTISSFFSGFYTGIFRDHFIMNALNPLAAYEGINVIYWLVFSAVCTAAASILIKKRRADRAQSSFAYYLPCHIIKVLVAFLAGMFLGVLFGSLNVFDNGVLGFVFGFVLGSVPAFIIAHLIFYNGFSKLVKTSIPLGGLIVVVIAGILFCNNDVLGYNSYIPSTANIEGAGYFSTKTGYVNSDESLSDIINNMADDFDDIEKQKEIIELHSLISSSFDATSQQKFIGVWINMLTDNLDFTKAEPIYCFAYRKNSGFTSTRVYSKNMLQAMNSAVGYYGSISDYDDSAIVTTPEYVKKYSGLARADIDDIKEFCVAGDANDKTKVYDNIITSDNEYNADNNSYNPPYEDCQKIREAMKKDLEQHADDFDKVMYEQNSDVSYDYSDDYAYNDSPYYSYEFAKEKYPDVVCGISLKANNVVIDDFSSIFQLATGNTILSSTYETYVIPKSFTNTIEALQDIGILNKDMTLNKNCQYAL